MNVVEKTKEMVADKIAEMGFNLFDVTLEPVEDGTELTVLIEKTDCAVTLDDCEAVSKIIDPILEEAGVIDEKYYLSVASVPVDHPSRQG